MSPNSLDPWKLASVDELLAMAAVMGQEAIDGYNVLSAQMKETGRPDLATVCDALVAQQRDHLRKVDQWLNELGYGRMFASPPPPHKVFDEEGAGKAAPGLLSAYRAFALAVRNEDRAFVFWSYVSAHARSEDIRTAAETMAREKLGHVAVLRQERRKAFHNEFEGTLKIAGGDLPALEERLSRHLQSLTAREAAANENGRLASLSMEADLRAKSMLEIPFGGRLSLARAARSVLESPLALCELLADCYLDIGDRAATEADADRARDFAAQVISCLRVLRP